MADGMTRHGTLVPQDQDADRPRANTTGMLTETLVVYKLLSVDARMLTESAE